MKMLLPYDGSAHSEAALDFVSTMAALRELTTRTTLIFEPPAMPRIGAPKARKSTSQVRADASRRVLAPAVRALRAAGLAVKSVHRVGDPAQCIVRRAATDGADLILMGTHGRAAWMRSAARFDDESCNGRLQGAAAGARPMNVFNTRFATGGMPAWRSARYSGAARARKRCPR